MLEALTSNPGPAASFLVTPRGGLALFRHCLLSEERACGNLIVSAAAAGCSLICRAVCFDASPRRLHARPRVFRRRAHGSVTPFPVAQQLAAGGHCRSSPPLAPPRALRRRLRRPRFARCFARRGCGNRGAASSPFLANTSHRLLCAAKGVTPMPIVTLLARNIGPPRLSVQHRPRTARNTIRRSDSSSLPTGPPVRRPEDCPGLVN